jgi:hypothetical protein
MQRNLDAMLDVVMEEARTVDGPILIVNVLSNANFTYNPTIMAEFAEAGIEFVVDDPVLIRQVGAHRAAVRHEPVAELWLSQYPDPSIDGELIYTATDLPIAEAERMEQAESEIADQIATRGLLHLSPDARTYLETVTPELLDDVEARLAAGDYSVKEVGQLYRDVYGTPLLWDDGEALDGKLLARWHELDRKREQNSVSVYFVRLDR